MEELNHGILLGSGTKNLYVGGTIPFEERLPSGDWRPFIPTHEKQRDPLETMACVSFSCNNSLEIQYKFFGIDINFSDRFLAKMSGTTPQGNYLDKVADTARLVGLVLESEYPNNPKATTWNEYYKTISMDIINKAVPQPIWFEDIAVSGMKEALKQCPIQIIITASHPNHAVTLVHIEGETAHYVDHYNYQLKTTNVSNIHSGLKIVLKEPNMTNSLIVQNGSEYGIFDPATSPDGLTTLLRNRGIPTPLKPDGSLDFDKLPVTKKLVDA